ncbi:MAG: rhodanese-like domain-containing protein [Anaerolineae bacterium]
MNNVARGSILLLLLLVTVTLVACGGQEAAPAAPGYTDIPAQELSRMLEEKDFLLINVHLPYQGEIAQTDLFIPFNAIEENASQLPPSRSAKIVVYCRSGAMSATAAETLVQWGYSNILNLDGGMIAWEEQGYPLLQNPR